MRQSEETNRAIIDATFDGVYLIDPQGKVLLANVEGARRYGQTPESILGKIVFDFVDPELAEIRRGTVRTVIRARKPLLFEYAGGGRHYFSSLYPLFDKHGKPDRIAVYTRDITEKKQSELTLRQTEETQRALLEAISESVLLIKTDGTGLFANSTTLKRLKLTQAEFQARNIYELLPPEVAAFRKLQVEKSRANSPTGALRRHPFWPANCQCHQSDRR